ncbi:MAG: hypothetical protein WCT05_10920 [Lentisphaeria bacterium]
MAILQVVLMIVLAGLVGLAPTGVFLVFVWLVSIFRRKPFTADKLLLMTWFFSTSLLAAIFLYWIFGVPDQKIYASPDGTYTVRVAFYSDISNFDCYRFKATLHDADSGDLLGEVEDTVRDVFLTFLDNSENSICWERTIWIEWAMSDGAQDKVTVIFPEMNTAYLLPSGESVFPLPNHALQ